MSQTPSPSSFNGLASTTGPATARAAAAQARVTLPRVGTLPAGARDAITDVPGVRVGQVTLAEGPIQTGVTVVLPHDRDPFQYRVPAAVDVINGFGKSVGLIQLQELGQLETPIALTNTFSVPAVAQAQIRQCVAANPRVGREWATVNPLVFECNDGFLNDIQRMAITESHYVQACETACEDVAQGAVGAGRGMSNFQLKGGIGTASRRCGPETGGAMVGALVLSNFGKLPHLNWAGQALGAMLAGELTPQQREEMQLPEKGSIIMILATDAPLDSRQLRRLATRAGAGLARTGSVYGHGSGDIALAFSTAYQLPMDASQPMPAVAMLHETHMSALFQAVADCVEQAIYSALWYATGVAGRDGHRRPGLRELLASDDPTCHATL